MGAADYPVPVLLGVICVVAVVLCVRNAPAIFRTLHHLLEVKLSSYDLDAEHEELLREHRKKEEL